jgi:hypothetical protein
MYEQSWASMDEMVLFLLNQEGDVTFTEMG